MTRYPSIITKHNVLVTWWVHTATQGWAVAPTGPPKKAEIPSFSTFQTSAGGQLLGMRSSPSPSFSWADPCPALPCLVLREGLSLSFLHTPAALSWASGPLVSGGTHGPCVDLEGWGEGQSRRNFLTRRAKDGVLPDPWSHDCAHPPCSARVTCHSSFFPCPACSGLHAHPTQGGREESGMEITDQCKKNWGPIHLP